MNLEKRKIQLKTSVNHIKKGNKELVHFTFFSMGETLPSIEAYDIKSDIKKEKLENFLKYMKSIDKTFFAWLEADAKNTILFANDPLEALKNAIPDLDESVFTELPKDLFV
ncbi:hypothetical protein GCQ56_19915 [Marinifilum sp. N1E240]|uniref:hypothetical protein n=1 Tax=Marinifilum sp. N1E240 TaxID=2608082 RepID=UPI00128DFF9D|nr:hypothetical protein [Marinifilum sp. N1E240]MPQ49273.1 hypothetical protein [Marinifilum sp. N1E240]